jgi:hypothetical protein
VVPVIPPGFHVNEYGAPFPPAALAVALPLQPLMQLTLWVIAVSVMAGGCVMPIVNVLIQVGSALALRVYVPAHWLAMSDVVEIMLPEGGDDHVNVIGGGGPLAVTEAPPLQPLLQVTLVMVGVIVMEVG